MFQMLFSCCLLASCLFLTKANVGMIRHLTKRQAETCANELVARQHAESFTSPGFPSNYPNNADCSWRMRTSPGNQIGISFVSFDVELERNCQYDYLIIYDGPDDLHPEVGRYCGQDLPADFTSTSPQVLVKFHSDTSDTEGGFEIRHWAIGNVGVDDGGEAPGGVVQGGDLVGDGLAGGEGQDLGGEPHEGFSGDDNVVVVSGDNAGGERPANDENAEHAEVSNADIARQIVEVTGCNQVWRDARRGEIMSPGYPNPYPANAECTTVIHAPPNHHIDLTFHSFDLEEYLCKFDYVVIKDSIAQDADPIVKLCGADLPDDVQSTTGTLVIHFISDPADERGGFRASFVSREALEVSTAIYEPEATIASETGEPLKFVSVPGDVTNLEVGDPVKLQCIVNLEGAIVQWFQERREIAAGVDSPEGVIVAEESLGSTLIIPSFEEEHEGIYVCQARLPGQPAIKAPIVLRSAEELSIASIESIVSVSPDYYNEGEDAVDFQTKPEDAAITDGGYHVLSCSSSGSHRIAWEKDRARVIYNARIYPIFADNLLVSDARVADSGTYSCVAYSEDGIKLGSVSAQLTVTSGLDVSDVCGLVTAKEAANDTTEKNRITNGEVALKGSSPWIARIWHRRLSKHFCGGSLINYRWVVTAAHCIRSPRHHLVAEQIEVRLGDHDSKFPEVSEQLFRVSRIVVHEDYRQGSFDNDIALLELDRRVPEFTDYVCPICLPRIRLSERLLVLGQNARVVGWGRIIEGGSFPRYLREVYVPIVPDVACRESAGSLLTGNMFCAGYRQAAQGDACQGDSGGPLAMKKGNKWHLLGVISWGDGCSQAEKYGFYCKVANYVTWMRNVMSEGM